MNLQSLSKMLPSIILIVIILGIYNVLKIYVFEKLRAVKWAKWAVLALTVLLAVLNGYIASKFGQSSWQYYFCMGLFVMGFFSFLDLLGFGRRSGKSTYNKKDDITIKPKAKPNRVKNKNTK